MGKTPPTDGSQLWLEMRRLENSWRAVSDIELALLEAMIANKKKAGEKTIEDGATRAATESYATVMKGFPPQPWPCLPPAPCTRSLVEIRELVRMLGELCKQTVKDFNGMLDEAKEMKIKEVTFRLTQSPSYPVTEDAGVTT